MAETEVVLDIQGHTARFRVAGNRDVLEADVNDFNRNLYLALSIFGFGGLGMNALAILFGLRPLDQARRSLEKIRAGESERLDGEFPREIQPLANEVNALIDSNRRIIERARMQVGNLAHSLKTPIAVLLNEARVLEAPHGDLVKAQAEAMQMQVQSYLNRARIAAQRESVLARTEAEPALERLVRVMRRLQPGKDLRADGLAAGSGPRHGAAGCRGNGRQPPGQCRALCQRAGSHHGARRAGGACTARTRGGGTGLSIDVEDDGPGLEPDQIARGDEARQAAGRKQTRHGSRAFDRQGNCGGISGNARPFARRSGGLNARILLPAVS